MQAEIFLVKLCVKDESSLLQAKLSKNDVSDKEAVRHRLNFISISISISGQFGVLVPRHVGSCWKGKHDTVCMYVCV